MSNFFQLSISSCYFELFPLARDEAEREVAKERKSERNDRSTKQSI